MQYMLLIYADPNREMPQGAAREALRKRYVDLTQEVRDAGKFVGGDQLESPDAATTVRVQDGKTLTTDGPFAETKEQLGGYFILECDDLDEAIAYAAKVPAAEDGVVEVRPLVQM